MRILLDDKYPDAPKFVCSGEDGQVLVELWDGTRLQLREVKVNDASLLEIYLVARKGEISLRVIPRVANAIWVGASNE